MEQHVPGLHRTFAPHPASVGDARRLMREVLVAAGREDLVESAELVVTELVTNALVHAGTPIDVAAIVDDAGLRIEVSDGSGHLPVLRRNGTLAGTGRGLWLVQSAVDDWGIDAHESGKCVWVEISVGMGAPGTYADPGRDVQVLSLRDDRGDVAVELLNVPLLLHIAWQQHAEALLREYLLFSLGDEGDVAGLQAHAASSDAIALLLDHLPDPGIGDDPDRLMATAVEPDVSSDREVLRVPVDSLLHFRVLGEALDTAIGLADAGVLLTPPTQPEMQAFRRWVCDEVERQSGGGGPLPWVDQSEAAPPPGRTPLEWASEVVRDSPDALIAADDTNGIVAVSRPALALLGYDDPDDLVGRRLMWIIPPRFRQAHLAGFTMHLTTGRAPLIGRPVTVPALCRDGSETLVELVVESQCLPGGRHVFVASLRR
ncbi:ATP-binding protein [Nocardioides ungokensis]